MKLPKIHGRTYIVMTSIFPASKAIQDFARIDGYKLVVAGDKKTPADWHYPGVDFIAVEKQNTGHLAKLLPYNHYCRKMCGYLHAMWEGADIIIDTDDDNIPNNDFPVPTNEAYHSDIWNGNWESTENDLGFVNMYQLYTDKKIWPRGLPLQFINRDFQLEEKISLRPGRVGIWQGLADCDPDVDAIYRLLDNTECIFNKRDPVVLGKGTISPFNSQNTTIVKELFPLLYLPTSVTFRFTDILRGLVAQPLMWMLGYNLGFTAATVFQERNPHNFMEDFESEMAMYLRSNEVPELVTAAANSNSSLVDNMHNAYAALEKKSVVEKSELESLDAWLRDTEKNPT